MNTPVHKKLRISHEEIIELWKKYQDGEINRIKNM